MKYILILILFSSSLGFAQQKKTILLTNAYLHVGNGETIETAAVGIKNGEITLVKNSLTYSYSVTDWDTIIDLKGQHMYPGLVAPNSTLGLTEIDAVRATRDYDEVGTLNPHIRALIAYNVESDVIATVRSNGVLITQITPRGGIVTGSSSVMHLDGWNWEDAAISVDDGIHLNWPSSFPGRGKAVDKAEETKRKGEYEKKKREIYSFFTTALAYAEKNNREVPELRLEAMKDCFKGKKRVYIHANELQQLLDVLDFTRHFELKFPVIIGGYDSYLILQQLHDSKIPVMLPRVHSLPENEDDPIDLPFRLPGILREADIKFCLQNEGDMEAMNARNIPFLAGHTTGFGLSREDALRSVSLSACEIMGIDKQYGSIEVGKKATLFVSKGSAFDMMTNDVTMALMNGVWVDLDDRQKQLYRKYKEKYKNQ
jgi:imidazolonepropionase-like amidohydrolase